MPQPHLLAADVDRAAVAEALGAHMSAGRLTLDEFDDRLARAYAARTYGDLDELTADLPPIPPSTPAVVPVPRPARSASRAAACHAPWPGGRDGDRHGGRHGSRVAGWHGGHSGSDAWRAWLRTGLLVLAIWAATSLASWELLYFWPVWVIGPWGAMLLLQTVTGRATGADTGNRQRLSA